jgi:hypothetical protein
MPKQIGWSNESNLLYTISSQISRLAGIIATSGGGGGGTITGGGASGQVTFWDAATNITGSNNLFWNNAQTRLGIGTNTPTTTLDVRGELSINVPSISGGRESILTAKVSDNATDVFGIANGTSTNLRFIPTFYAYSNDNYSGLILRGLTSSAGDSGSSPLINLQVYRTDSTTNPNNGIFSAIATRPILAISNGVGTTYAQIFATGNLVLQNGGTFTDDNTNRLQVQGSTLLNGNVTFSSSTGMFWDATNSRLGIGTNAPSRQLVIYDGASGVPHVQWANSSTGITNGDGFQIRLLSTNQVHFTNFENSAMYFGNQGITGQMTFYPSGNLAVGTSASDSGERLQVTGDVKITGKLALTVVTNRQTVNYSLVLADNGKLVETNVGAANTITVPPNSSIAFPIGTKIDIAQYGAGQTTIVPGIGVTVRSAGGALKLSAQYSGATIVKIGTDEWYLFGDITV